jgi:hypothetical protein
MSKASISRRTFTLSSLLGLFVIPFTRDSHSTTAAALNFQALFSAVIDTFVPQDAYPGALDLGIDQRMLTKINSNKNYHKQIYILLSAIHELAKQQYSAAFETLDVEERSLLISHAMRANTTDKATRLSLHSLQIKTFNAFYTSEPAYQMLDYHPPSQGGYPDYARPLSELLKS